MIKNAIIMEGARVVNLQELLDQERYYLWAISWISDELAWGTSFHPSYQAARDYRNVCKSMYPIEKPKFADVSEYLYNLVLNEGFVFLNITINDAVSYNGSTMQ